MECHDRITQVIHDAIEEVNQTRDPGQAVPASPETVLIGEAGQLDSLGFVALAVTIEEQIERLFNEPISVIELVTAGEASCWTVDSLAARIAELLEHRPRVVGGPLVPGLAGTNGD
jgi:acyl carrier protein